MEDQVQGQQQAAQEAIADWTLEESHEFGFEVGMASLLEPILQRGPRHAGLLGEPALGVARPVGMVEVVAGLGGLDAVPTEGVWPVVGRGVKLRRSHGPCP
jgi:hypothetical protein